MLKVYGFARVNPIARGNTRDLRVLWALEEMQLPYEVVGMDHPAHDLNTEAYHQLNPLEQIPVIDDDGIVLSESGAILLYLARKTGKLIPADSNGDAQVMRWCFVALNSLEIPMMSIQFIDFGMGGASVGEYRKWVVGWANRHLGNLERWLDGREFVAVEMFTVADILVANVLGEIADDDFFKPFPRVLAYRERCKARPAWHRALEAYCERVQAG